MKGTFPHVFNFILNFHSKAEESHRLVTIAKADSLGLLGVFQSQKDKGFDPKARKPDSASDEEGGSKASD